MKRVLAAVFLFAAPVAASAQGDDPAAAVNAFYSVYSAQHAQGLGIPDATVRLRLQPVLSPRLNKQLATAASAQARLTAKVKNAVPPVLEGDIFSSLFEGPTAWKVGSCQQKDKTARCSVALSYVPPPTPGSKAKPANWTDTMVLAATAQGWKVDDVIYDAGFAFGNTGRLSEMLNMVIASNP
jgi:hypothetical protein